MTDDLKVELQLLENVARSWDGVVKTGLSGTAQSIDELKFSRLQFGIFQIPWGKYTETAVYIQDRLNEGSQSASDIGGALYKVARTFEQQDTEQAAGIRQAQGDMGFSI
ncbi:hypothetical protein [Nocardia australiensis]|uniref:hypothetical protein n=1 Tax=Nocardia australiensis TaxID=2887191 RepID=UPI001D1449DB|nr:hypothetical protein [Nocardia australiensis]